MLRAGITVVVAVLILANDASAHKVFHVNKMTRHFAQTNQRRFTSGSTYASGSGGAGGVPASSYASGYTSGATTTTTTTTTTTSTGGTTTGKSSGFTPVSGSTKITQKITFASLTVSQYTGNLKLCYETGYARGLDLLQTDLKTFKNGAKVESTAKAARRAGTAVTFVATAPPSLAAAAKTKAAAIASDTSKLVTAINDVKNANTAFSSVTVPTASSITAEQPTSEVIVSAAPTSSSVSLLAIVALAAATLALN